MMNAEFTLTVKCRAENVDVKLSAEELKKKIEELFYYYSGINAVAEVTDLTYTEEG